MEGTRSFKTSLGQNLMSKSNTKTRELLLLSGRSRLWVGPDLEKVTGKVLEEKHSISTCV